MNQENQEQEIDKKEMEDDFWDKRFGEDIELIITNKEGNDDIEVLSDEEKQVIGGAMSKTIILSYQHAKGSIHLPAKKFQRFHWITKCPCIKAEKNGEHGVKFSISKGNQYKYRGYMYCGEAIFIDESDKSGTEIKIPVTFKIK